MLVKHIETGQLGTIPDEKFDPGLFERVGNRPDIQLPQQPQGKSVGGFFGNVGRDVGENISGLLAIPGLLGQILSGQADLGKTGQVVGKGIYNEYKDLVTNPVETAYQKPVSSVLDVLPFLAVAKVATAGKLTGTAGKAGLIGKTAELAKVAETSPKAGILERMGSSLRQGVNNPQVTINPFFAEEEAQLSTKMNQLLGGGSSYAKAQNMPKVFRDLTTQIVDTLTPIKKPVGTNRVIADFDEALGATNFDDTILGYTKAKGEFSNIIVSEANKGKTGLNLSPLAIYNLKKRVSDKIPKAFEKANNPLATLTPKEEVGLALWHSLDKTLTKAVPQVKALTLQQSTLYKAAPGLKKANEAKFQLPAVGTIPGLARPVQAGQDLLGSILQTGGKAGVGGISLDRILSAGKKTTSATVKSPLSYILGRQLNQPKESELAQDLSEEDTQLVQSLQGSFDTTPKTEITKDQLKAVLLSPDISEKTKTRIKEIYKLGEGSADEKKKSTQKANAERVIDHLENLYFSAQGAGGGRVGGVYSLLQKSAGGNPELQRYTKLKQTVRPLLARAVGEVGNLAAGEQEAIVGSLPSEFSTMDEAMGGFNDLRIALGIKPKKINSEKPNYPVYYNK